MANIELKLYEISTQASAPGAITLALVNKKASVTVDAPSDSQQGAIKLYRRGGSLTAGHYFVGTFPLSTLGPPAPTYILTDNLADAGLGSAVLLDNDMPVTSVSVNNQFLPFIWGPFNGMVLGCGDPNRPEAAYWSKAGNADAWPPQNWLFVSNPGDGLVNGCVFNTRCFAFSRERLYEMIQGLIAGVTFSAFPTPCARGLISPYGICVADAIYFVAKDGVYRTSGGPEESLVEDSIKPLFPTQDGPGRDVNGYEAVDLSQIGAMRLSYHNAELWFGYVGLTSGNQKWLIYDLLKGRWRAAVHGPSIRSVLSEPATASSLLLGDSLGDIYTSGGSTDNGAAIPVTLSTGSYDQGVPLNQKEYSSVLFDLDPGGATTLNPVIITPLLNGEVVTDAAIQVIGSGRQQVPLNLGDVFGFNIEFLITWNRTASINPVLYQFDILHRIEPAQVAHFEVRETSHGLSGFQHIRDMYVCLRSNADVTLTLTSGTSIYTYVIPSTGGLRKKVYVPMQANKFKLVRYQFDSTAGFRLYVSDSEVRVKSWVTPLGYSIQRPFGAEGVMATSVFEGNIESAQ